MRRCLSILLLVLLPLQFAWSQAADYDDLLDGSSHGMHFGHHTHGHADSHHDPLDAAGGDTDGGGQPPGIDGHHCHGVCAVIPTAAVHLPALPSASTLDTRHRVHGGTHAPPRPERPKWARLA